ncbi:MAG: OprO/OprP family phosphate-selective porin [Candidatus Brocadia sp.]|nr:OprO/OprP family phosphate-selective porin [Candidatus Brocadia sp.]
MTTTARADSDNLPKTEAPILPEDYYFNVESVSAKEEDRGKFQFHGFFAVTSPVQGRDDETQQPSSKFLEGNELTLWVGKQIFKRLSFDSEIEIKKGFQEYELERFEFDYEIIDKLLVFRIGKFKFPLGIERFVEAAPLNKLVDRPLPSIRVIPGTYSDIGGMFYGSISLPNTTLLKYEFAVTNGLEGPEPKDVQQLRDNNSNKTIGGRLGYEFLPGLEIGGSYSRGKYDEDNQLDIDFLGADILFKRGNLEVRGEYITSRVEQKAADGGDYLRNGYYLQTSYKHPFRLDYVQYLEGVLRFDSVDPNRDVTDGNEADRLAVGMNYFPIDYVELKFEYELENEPGEGIQGKSFVQAIFRW